MNPLNIVPQGWLTNTSGVALIALGAIFIAWTGAAQMYPANVPPCPSMLADAALPMIGMGLVALGLKRGQVEAVKTINKIDKTVSLTDPNAAAIAEAEAETGKSDSGLVEQLTAAAKLVAALKAKGLHGSAAKLAEILPDLATEPKEPKA